MLELVESELFCFLKKYLNSSRLIHFNLILKFAWKYSTLSSEIIRDWDEFWITFGKTLQMFLRLNCLSLSDHNNITNSSKSRKQTKDKLQSEGPSVNTLTTPQSELESFPLSWITKTRAVLDSCAYNSLLILTVEDRNKRLDQIYMFQCEEIGVSHTLPEPSRERRKCLISRPLPIFHDYVPLIAVALEFAVVFKRICLAAGRSYKGGPG